MTKINGNTENVRVAVRVRPFNNREKQRNAKCIIEMQDHTTVLFNPNDLKEKPKKFTFDHSYWSNDGFKVLNDQTTVADNAHPNGSKFSDQNKIYEEIGKPILENAFNGYNAALFAYGQTGSGKSYTVVGYGKNKGIVPRLCEDLFNQIKSKKERGDQTQFEVRFSMMEIYNEIVRDLCNPKDLKNKKGLKVREHITKGLSKGFYAEGLKSFLVTNQQEIEQKIEEGTTNRSIAATNMNETSSRAHTIVAIEIIQRVQNKQKEESTKISVIHLVDLAGSERLSATSSSGDRLKEGVSINLSLSCLGNCIHALAEKSNGKNTRVPFRDSVLTRLLMNALGGNSKTVMIATISPADINYEETYSTLRYADRAKQIKTHAVINENSTTKVLKMLREENDRLKKMMQNGIPKDQISDSKDFNDMKKKWEEEMQAAMKDNERRMTELKQSYEEKLREKQEEEMRKSGRGQMVNMSLSKEIEQAKKKNPYLYNLNFDEQLTGKIVHIVNPGTNTLGKSNQCNIHLYGPSIQETHARLIRKGNSVILEKANDNCRILLNGDLVKTKVNLNHNDRLLFGTTQLFVFFHPLQENKNNLGYSEITFELAQEEIALKSGFELNSSEDQSFEIALLNKDLLEVLPGIELANAISEELNKNVRFEIMLVSPQFLGKISHLSNHEQTQNERTEVFVKVYDLMNNLEFEWPKEKFLNRLYIMKEMYQNYENNEQGSENNDWDLAKDKDPFYEDVNKEQLIGTSQLYLQPLSFLVEINEQLEILDYRGNEVAFLNVELNPCDEKEREFSELDDNFVDSPFELIGKPLYFKLKIHSCRGLSSRFTDIYVKYRMFLDSEFARTATISNTSNPDFNYVKFYSFEKVTRQLVDYLKDGYINLLVYGKQISKPNSNSNNHLIQSLSRQKASSIESESMISNQNLAESNENGDKQALVLELMNMRRQKAKLNQRLDNIRMLIEASEEQRKLFIPVKLVKDLLSITTQELAQSMIMKTMGGHNSTRLPNDVALYQPNSYDHHYDLNGIESKASVRKESQSATCIIS